MDNAIDTIRYVAVEITLNIKKLKLNNIKCSEKLEYGLLKGLKVEALDEKKDRVSVFMTILKDGEINRITNLKYYSILTIEIGYGANREIIFYSDEDQEAAFNKIVDIMCTLKDQGMLTDNESIIDTDKYKNVPKKLEGECCNFSETTATKTKNSIYISNNTSNQTAGRKTTQHYGPTMSMFKRRSKKPTKKLLKSMKHKISQITSGDYKPPPPKKIRGEKKDEKHTETIDKKDYWAGY